MPRAEFILPSLPSSPLLGHSEFLYLLVFVLVLAVLQIFVGVLLALILYIVSVSHPGT